MSIDIKEINARVQSEGILVKQIQTEVGRVIVGQEYLIERLIIALLCNGHILIEGVPGLAKTLSVKTLADAVHAKFQRVQFTPDLLPADLIGTLIYNPKDGTFVTRKGPIFANLILADEINRAPAKVQSALLEAMQERQVTIGENTFRLDDPFLVLATQNPIEQEGTYPLPEAQVDRFMLKLRLQYPDKVQEREILERMSSRDPARAQAVISVEDIARARDLVQAVYMDEKIKSYILEIVFSTRYPDQHRLGHIKNLIAYGASPRASIYLALTAKAHAFINGRGYVTPDDVKAIGVDVLRHRIITTFEAEAESISPDEIVKKVFSEVEVP